MAEEIVGNEGGEGGSSEGGQEQSGGKETILTATDKDAEGGDAKGKEAEGGDAKGKDAEDDKSKSKGDADEKSKDSDKNADGDEGGAPEKYEAFEMPKGVEIDQVLMDEFIPIARELNLSQSQAQQVAGLVPKIQAAVLQSQVQAYEDQTTKHIDEIKNDPEFGKGKFDATVGFAKRAMRDLGVEGDLEKAMEETGAGNHPAFIKAFARIGKMIGEDTIDFGMGGEKKEISQADRMFPNQGKK